MGLTESRPRLKWAGVLAAAGTLPAPGLGLGVAGRLLPGFIGDARYDVVQRHRLDGVGRRATCSVPPAAPRRCFLTNAGALT